MRVLTHFNKKPLLFQKPEFIISCFNPAEFNACFQEMESALKSGYYLAGFFSYEAGYQFEDSLRENKTYEFPLIYLGVYKAPLCRGIEPKRQSLDGSLKELRLNITQDKYSANIQEIRRYIEKGDVYQITYCIKLLFQFAGDPFSLYHTLFREQPVPYPAYIDTGLFQILSLSPEMFIKKIAGSAVTKPMKGTWQRGSWLAADLTNRWNFQYDEKNRAENVMIADLLRNDLGRVGVKIRAPKLFEVAKYRKLFQMTSTVTGRIDRDISIYGLFSALFPSGSVTGAPKIRAMGIIRGLELEERKIYTGAIGYISPDRDMFFNIPIRTILINQGLAEMGIGGGIVWDSTAQGEWEEGLLKARFLTDFGANFRVPCALPRR
ncbi:MAG: chorismate-binding protein [Candidatus Omnitrophota bacterium]|jgi:para-aminobenzoate synthetase/4-amino-4-deoxychorismate lyase